MVEVPRDAHGNVNYGEIFAPGWARDRDGESTECGPGSLPKNTLGVQSMLAKIIRDFDVRSINNVGCGDMAWMAPFLDGVRRTRTLRHIGYDVVRWSSWADLEEPYDLRLQDGTREPLEPADLTVVRDLTLHLENEPVQAVLRNSFRSSALVFATSFNTGETPEPFTNDAAERAERFTTPRLNLNHAMLDLTQPPFSLELVDGYTVHENYPGKVMLLFRREDQRAEWLA